MASCPASPGVERFDLPVGYRVFDTEVDAAWSGGARTVPVNLWYPTEARSGTAATYIGLFTDAQSLVDAAFADPAPGCTLPLVVYSHGSQAWGGNASPLLRHLVAQGWVAAAPDHVGNTLVDNVEPHRASYSFTRVADVLATVDALDALDPSDALYQRVDTSRVLVVGHSYGGQTAWMMSGPTFDVPTLTARCGAEEGGCTDAELAVFAAGVDDPRVVGVVPLDGDARTGLVSNGWADAEAPIFYMARAQDNDQEPFVQAAAARPTWARFDGACHETFTSTPVSCESFEKEEGLDVVAVYLSAFAAATMMGDVSPSYAEILDGTTAVDERVTVSVTDD